jgi:hypothetical protein
MLVLLGVGSIHKNIYVAYYTDSKITFMSLEGIELYPFDKLPNEGIAAINQITEEQYLQYEHAVQLSPDDQAILQAIYIWIQTYFRAGVGADQTGAPFADREINTPLAISTYPSYSELWWLTNFYKQLQHVVFNVRLKAWQWGKNERIELHSKLYTDAMNKLGLNYLLTTHKCRAPISSRFQYIPLLSYGTFDHKDFDDKVDEIARLLVLNATFTKEYHELSLR